MSISYFLPHNLRDTDFAQQVALYNMCVFTGRGQNQWKYLTIHVVREKVLFIQSASFVHQVLFHHDSPHQSFPLRDLKGITPCRTFSHL